MKSYRMIIIPDTHIPYHDEATLSAVEKFISDYQWDEWIHLGDLLDFDTISTFNIDNFRELETRRIVEDYGIANDLLDRHQRLVRKNCKKAKFTLLEGNHEERMERLINKAPHLEGLLEVKSNLRCEKRGMKWVKSWSEGELYKVGHLYFSHGLYINKYHAAKMIDSFGVNIAYGHAHDTQTYVKQTLGKDKIIKATCLGHLCDEYKLTWMQKRPSNWVQAIGVAELRPSGEFNLYTLEIINHQFTFNGKTYKP